MKLINEGVNDCEISRRLGIPRGTIRDWRRPKYVPHWPCLFPQHGVGAKHLRDVALWPWQQLIVDQYPRPFLRGLIHSDGWRGTNFAVARGRRYEYPRYQFTNESVQLHEMFRRACDVLGVNWTSCPRQTYVSRRDDVAFLDSFIGFKN